MTARFNLITEGGEVVPFASAADLFAFVESRMGRSEDEDEEE